MARQNPSLLTQNTPSSTRRETAHRPQGPDTSLVLQRAYAAPSTLTATDVLTLQRTIGNRATVGLLQRQLGIQPKLRLGPAGDAYEQEADQMARQVVQRIQRPPIQRQDEEGEVQRQPLTTPTHPISPASAPKPAQTFVRPQLQRQASEDEGLAQMKPMPAPARINSKITFVMPAVQRVEEEDELVQMKPMHGPEGGEVEVVQRIQRQEDGENGPAAPLPSLSSYTRNRAQPQAAPVQRRFVLSKESPGKIPTPQPRIQRQSTPPSLGRTFAKPRHPQVQRAAEEDEPIQLQPMHGPEGGEVDRSVESQIAQARGGGKTLDAGVRRSMEGAFGADFRGVRVHTGAQADTLNRSLNARAFTTGNDIFFRKGEYKPGSSSGQKLLAHELTHTVQQGVAGVQRETMPVRPDRTPSSLRRYTGIFKDDDESSEGGQEKDLSNIVTDKYPSLTGGLGLDSDAQGQSDSLDKIVTDKYPSLTGGLGLDEGDKQGGSEQEGGEAGFFQMLASGAQSLLEKNAPRTSRRSTKHGKKREHDKKRKRRKKQTSSKSNKSPISYKHLSMVDHEYSNENIESPEARNVIDELRNGLQIGMTREKLIEIAKAKAHWSDGMFEKFVEGKETPAVKYLDENDRKTYELKLGNLIKQGQPPMLFDTSKMYSKGSGDGYGIFVMSLNGAFYADQHVQGFFHHSSFLSGGVTGAAGEIKVEQGKLVHITNKSGHYTPEVAHLMQAIDALYQQGVSLSGVKVSIFSENGKVDYPGDAARFHKKNKHLLKAKFGSGPPNKYR